MSATLKALKRERATFHPLTQEPRERSLASCLPSRYAPPSSIASSVLDEFAAYAAFSLLCAVLDGKS